MTYIRMFIIYFSFFCITFTYFLNSVYIAQIIFAALEFKKNLHSRKRKDHALFLSSHNMMPASILVPAFNERETIIDNMYALLRLDYPTFEVIVINDGSTDDMHERILRSFHLRETAFPVCVRIKTRPIRKIYRSLDYPNLVYVDKENGGKADALNVGINISRYPLVTTIDADSLLEKDALLKLNMKFLEDPSTIAVGGTVRIVNDARMEDGEIHFQPLPKQLIVKFQMIEYFRAFFGGRISWNHSNAVLIVSGAFGSFRKSALIECGGYSSATIGEDMDLIVKLHHHHLKRNKRYRIEYILDPVCWTQAPDRIAGFRSQRKRWQIGLLNTLLNYRSMILNPRYGKVGVFAIPYYWLFDVLGPIVECLGYIIIPLSFLFGELSAEYFFYFLAASILLGMILSIGGILLEQYSKRAVISARDSAKLILFALLENLGYRQLTTLFRVEGMLTYRKHRNQWGNILRK